MYRDTSNEGKRKLYKILVGSDITKDNSANITKKEPITSNICKGTT